MTLVTTATELPRLMRCMGSRLLNSAVPDNGDTEARDEGNAADWLAEQLFADRAVSVGSKAPNGWVITDDMMEHINDYIDTVRDYPGTMQMVTTFGLPGVWEVRGRADWISWDGATLRVRDLKYGHRIVSPVENWTLMAHAIGWWLNTGIAPQRVELSIFQPRPYHDEGPLRTWEMPLSTGYYDRLNQRLSNPDDLLVSGPEQCAKCHARFDCPALDRSAWAAVEMTTTAFNDAMPNNVLAFERDAMQQAADMLKIKIDAVEELMTHRIKSGQVIQGYAMEPRQGQRRFKTGLTAHALSAALGVDLTTDKLPTPAEAERRGVDKAVLAALTERPMIGAKLKKIDADAVARRAFGDRT